MGLDDQWQRYEKVILYRLDQQDRILTEVLKKVTTLHEQMTLLKWKTGLIGTVAGTIAGIAVAWFSR